MILRRYRNREPERRISPWELDVGEGMGSPQTEARSFDMDDLLAIVGEEGGPYDNLRPVRAIRIKQLYFSSPAGIQVSEDVRAAYDKIKEDYGVEKAGEYKAKAREFRGQGKHREALQAIEDAVICDDTNLALWKAAGDYAVEAGDARRARRYYEIVMALPRVRGGFEAINESDREVVVAAFQAPKGL